MTFQSINGSLSFFGTDDKEYALTPLTLSSFSTFVTWVQYKPYRDAVTADLPAKICKDILKECQLGIVEEEISEGNFAKFPINLNSTIVTNTLQTTEGFSKFLQISLSLAHPECLNNSHFDSLITDENLEGIFKPLLIFNGLLNKEEAEPEKNQQGPKKNLSTT